MKLILSVLTAAALAVTLTGCGDSHDHSSHGGGHHHSAPHGGMLMEIGQHEYNLEFVVDSAAGKLDLYVLDGHAENFVRIAMPAIEVIATAGGKTEKLVLQPVANNATGEKAGDTSQFQAQADWLKTTPVFDGVINEINIKGSKHTFLPFRFPK
jgi:hypothetical protein